MDGMFDRITTSNHENSQLAEMGVVGKPIEASEVVVRSNWRLEGLRWE